MENIIRNNIMAARTNKTDINKRKFLRALKKYRGLVTTAAAKSNLCRAQHYYWMEHDPEYKTKVEEIYDAEVDGVESILFDLISSGNTAATIFYLKSKGKKRDYGNQIQVDAKIDGEIKINAIFNDDLLKE